MGQKESNRNAISGLPGSPYSVTATGFAYPSYAHEDNLSQPSLPGDLMEGPIPGWDNAWIDLGGEG